MNFKKFSREVEKAEKGMKGREHFENVLALLCIPPLSVPAVYVSLAIYYPLRDFTARYCYHKDRCLEFISSSAGSSILSIVSVTAVGAVSYVLWDMFLRSVFQSLSEAMLSASRSRKLGGMDIQSAGRALPLKLAYHQQETVQGKLPFSLRIFRRCRISFQKLKGKGMVLRGSSGICLCFLLKFQKVQKRKRN
jgi:hypothetical protein